MINFNFANHLLYKNIVRIFGEILKNDTRKIK